MARKTAPIGGIDPAKITTLTLDCYGTLIDWESGAIEALRPLLDRKHVALSDDEIIEVFGDIESELCKPPYRTYRAILASTIEGIGEFFGFSTTPEEKDILAASIPSWKPFPDTVAALEVLGKHYRLAIISNIDDDLFAPTASSLGIKFSDVITAEQARSYKPGIKIFEFALKRLKAPRGSILHVAEGASEVVPARRLGCGTAWLRRNGRSARLLTEPPDVELPDMRSLVNWLGEIG